jgi:hypothetical protein
VSKSNCAGPLQLRAFLLRTHVKDGDLSFCH